MKKIIYSGLAVCLCFIIGFSELAFAQDKSEIVINGPGSPRAVTVSTAAVTMNSAGKIHLEAINARLFGPRANVNYWLYNSGGTLLTQGTLEPQGSVAFGVNVPAGSYRLYLNCDENNYECAGYGRLSNY